MTRRIRVSLASIFTGVACSCLSLFGFQWPVENRVLTATFGESRWDHFHTGIDLGGGSQTVRPIEAGEVIYYFDRSDRRRTPPSGLGSFVVLEHERGIRSIYAHLEEGSIGTIDSVVDQSTELGRIGDTGASLGKHLHLEIIDSELNNYVNPLLVLPVLEDSTEPVIRGVRIIPEGGDPDAIPIPLFDGAKVPSGNHRLLVELFDLSQHVAYFCPMAPFRVSGFLNGSEVFDIAFESIGEEGGSQVMDLQKTIFDEFYYDDWVLDVAGVPFRVGEIQMEIVARDITDNETVFRLAVSVE